MPTVESRSERLRRRSWQGCFASMLKDMAPRLTDVLQARGCREGWVQGEFFRLADKHAAPGRLDVNSWVPSISRGAFDLSCSGPNAMIAEIKIVGGGYLRKNINGWHTLRDLPEGWSLAGCDGAASRDQISFNPNEGSIFKDLSRLWGENWNEPYPLERHMIVIIPDEGIDTNIGPILTSMCFAGKEWKRGFSGFLVRMWQLETP